MGESKAKIRMAENEVVFRQYNEKIQKGFAELKVLAQEEGHHSLVDDDDMPLHFYCECSDEDCTKRVILKPSLYSKIHKSRNSFVLIPGHETKSIERTVTEKSGYNVVEKFISPPQKVTQLNPTPLRNA